MSRIGRQPVTLPKGVKATIDGTTVTVNGPKGKLIDTFHPDMTISQDDGVLTVSRASDAKFHRSLHGLTRSLLDNMVLGVSEGFQKTLRIEGVGYRAELKGSDLILSVGYSHPVVMPPPEGSGISYEVLDRGRTVIVTGINKQIVGEVSAKIRKTRPPEPYKGKGIRYDGEVVRRKAGKAGKV